MAYKAMRRRVMEPEQDARLRAQAAKVYSAIGLPLPGERKEEDAMRERSHGGSVLVTTFHPTDPGPKLNTVHGPLAAVDPLLTAAMPVVGLPIVGAALEARMLSDHPRGAEGGDGMDVGTETTGDGRLGDRPYFYPRRAKKGSSGVVKRKSSNSRHPKNKSGVRFR